MLWGVERSFIGVPCHGADRVGMTKVYCSSWEEVGPSGIHLRMRIQWFVGFSNGQLAYIFYRQILLIGCSGLLDAPCRPVAWWVACISWPDVLGHRFLFVFSASFKKAKTSAYLAQSYGKPDYELWWDEQLLQYTYLDPMARRFLFITFLNIGTYPRDIVRNSRSTYG